MEAVGRLRLLRTLAVILLAVSLVANGEDVKSWANLDSIAAGQALEIRNLSGRSVRGNYTAHSEQSIDLSVNQQLVSIPRIQISAIRLRTRTQKAIWIGLGLGAAAGAAVGAGIGSGVSNESGGDFSNLTPLVIGVCAGVGALVGLGIGSVLANRHRTIYRAK